MFCKHSRGKGLTYFTPAQHISFLIFSRFARKVLLNPGIKSNGIMRVTSYMKFRENILQYYPFHPNFKSGQLELLACIL